MQRHSTIRGGARRRLLLPAEHDRAAHDRDGDRRSDLIVRGEFEMAMQAKSISDRLMAAFGQWVMASMDMLFAIARNLFPILLVKYRGKSFALVTRFADVQEVLL